MTDFDAECAATLEAARKITAEGERLAESCRAASREREEWEKANGLDAENRGRFFAELSPEDRKKAEEEKEAFNRELRHDLERATAPAEKKPGKTRRRGYA